MLNLLSLPDELLHAIILNLQDELSILNAAKTNRKLFYLAIRHLYRLNERDAAMKRAERHAATQRREDEAEDDNDSVSDGDSDRTVGSTGDDDDPQGEDELYRLSHWAIYWALQQNSLATLRRAQAVGVNTYELRLARLAASAGNVPFLEHLLQDFRTARDLPPQTGSRLIEAACRGGHVDVVKKLFELRATLSFEPWRSLRAAACARYEDDEDCRELISLLVSKGVELDAVGNDGQTALSRAVNLGFATACAALVDNGADLTIRDSWGWTLLSVAVRNTRGPLHIKNEIPRTNVVEALLKRGADPRAHEPEMRWPLITAVENYAPFSIVKMLIEHGADVNAPNEQGCTPLLAAATRGNSDIVQLLVEKGAQVDNAAGCGCTPFAHTCEAGHADCIQLLLDNGADMTKVNIAGNSSLHLAAGSGSLLAVETVIKHWRGLLAKGSGTNSTTDAAQAQTETSAVRIPVDKRDSCGRTALFYAARVGASNIASTLVNAGASASIKDNFGATAIFAAVRNGHAEAARVLLDAYPPGIDEFDAFGRRLVDWACETGPTALVKLVNKYNGQPVLTEMPTGFYGPAWNEFEARKGSCAICVRPLQLVQHCWWCGDCADRDVTRRYFVCEPCHGRCEDAGIPKCLEEGHAAMGEWKSAAFARGGCYLTCGVQRVPR
jgi:ankyrin repeat protein